MAPKSAFLFFIRPRITMESSIYSIPGFQEPVSSFSHLFAAPVFAFFGYKLIRRGAGDWRRVVSLFVMAASAVFLLAMSGVYHLLGFGLGRYVLERLDIAGVFVLIAGTATPVHTILFKGPARWAPLTLFWGIAVAGITLCTIFAETLPDWFRNSLFLLMGWGGLYAFAALWRRYGALFVLPLLLGGLAYTFGVCILAFHWPALIPGIIGPHELWHVAVLLGLAQHWRFVSQFAEWPL